MKSTSIRTLKVLIFINLLLLILALFFGGSRWAYSVEIAFISSSLVMVASLLSYRRMVNARVEHNIMTYDDSKDVIDKLEDPYDLYTTPVQSDEETKEQEQEEEEKEDFAAIVKEERQKLKKNRRPISQTLKDSKAALSLYRLGAYAVLILGFLYLNRHGLLHLPSYLLALGIPPVVIVSMLMFSKEESSSSEP